MAYTGRELVTRSWQLSGIVARRLQSVSGDQATDGLFLLNALLAWKSIEVDLIPYWTYYEFDAVIDQEKYFIENLLQIESVTFNQDTVRYAMEPSTRTNYFATARLDNIQSLPFQWYFNREKGGGSLYLYFKPAANYRIKLMGKFGLLEADLDTDLLLTYDKSYLEYLRYELANYMCSEYGIIFNPQSEKILKRIRRTLMYVSPPDLSVRKGSMFMRGLGISFADVNIGFLWRP